MSKKIAVKKTVSVPTSETDDLLSKYAEQYDVPVAKLREAHENIKNTELKGAKNADKRALVKLLGSLREGRLVDTEPASFLLFGVGSLTDRQEFNLKTVRQYVVTEVAKIFNDLEKKGSLNLGAPTYKRKTGATEALNMKVTAWHPSKREEAVKEFSEKDIHDVEVKIAGANILIPCIVIDTLKTFPKTQEENRNFNKPVNHQFSRRYIGIGIRHNAEEEGMYTPVYVTCYGESSKKMFNLHQVMDWDVKVTEITNDKKDVVMVAFSIPEFSEATKVYENGENGKMDESWVVNNQDDVTEILEVADQWFTEQSGITRSIDTEDITSLFLNKKQWNPMVKNNQRNLPELYTSYFQVTWRSDGVLFGDVIAGRVIDADAPAGDISQNTNLAFKTCVDNPLSTELRKGDVIKAIYFFQETNVYDRELKQRTQELEPEVYLMGWSWERRAGSAVYVEGEEVS